MTIIDEVHRPELYWEYDATHPSKRKVRITTNVMAGCMWVSSGDSSDEWIEIAAHWISSMMGWAIATVKPVVVD